MINELAYCDPDPSKVYLFIDSRYPEASGKVALGLQRLEGSHYIFSVEGVAKPMHCHSGDSFWEATPEARAALVEIENMRAEMKALQTKISAHYNIFTLDKRNLRADSGIGECES